MTPVVTRRIYIVPLPPVIPLNITHDGAGGTIPVIVMPLCALVVVIAIVPPLISPLGPRLYLAIAVRVLIPTIPVSLLVLDLLTLRALTLRGLPLCLQALQLLALGLLALGTLSLDPLLLDHILLEPAALLILLTFRLAALFPLTECLLRLILLHTFRLRPLPLGLGLGPRLFCPSLLIARLSFTASLFLTRRIVASDILILIQILLRLRPLSSNSLGRGND